MTDLFPILLAQADHGAHAPAVASATTITGTLPTWAGFVPLLPLLACILCGLCAAFRVKSKLPALITVVCLAISFVITFFTYQQTMAGGGGHGQTAVVHLWDWINFHWSNFTGGKPVAGVAPAIIANFSFYIDPLTCLWMLFVTGLATLIGLYASEYMAHDKGPGYCRFFAAFNLFVFSMACLVMGDNLLLLFLGWEGVGLCSYLLIGYFYQKPSAVAAGKKAFIMNRIGDLGLSMGVMLTYVYFGTVEYAKLFPMIQEFLVHAQRGEFGKIPFLVQLIPILFTVGAFGKSAQLPLFVWLPDAMEGPTPVSALIHAATMVTAGVYLVARFLPLYQCSEWALPIVAWTGALTALLAATIGMAQFDIKRIMAYSTVSQLGYMFCGLGVLGAAATPAAAAAGPYHVFTHAFFKALLFLSCGAVMHGFAGQVDLRKLSGVWKMPGWWIVGAAMLVGCLNLAGFPFITAGFYSKDAILAEAFGNHSLRPIGWILLLTAGLTAYYTFRVFFRVFVGPRHFEPGDEVHAHAHDDHGHDHAHEPGASATGGHHETHDFHPHPPGWAINAVLAILAIASFVAIVPHYKHWVPDLLAASTTAKAAAGHAAHAEHATLMGMDLHTAMIVLSSIAGVGGILIAFYLHLLGRTTAARSRADDLLPFLGPIPKLAQGKWYVDEFYDFLIVKPLWVLSHILYLLDKGIDGIVNLFGWMPRAAGHMVRKQQTGVLHDYAVSMAAGITIVVLIVIFFTTGGKV